MKNAMATPRIVTRCAPARPTCLPKRPATSEPTSGASGTARRRPGEKVAAMASAFERIELVDGDRRARAEEHDEDRQADRRLGGGDGEDEEDEDLAAHVAEVVREGDEVEVGGEQHQLDRHEQDDQVLAVEE